MPIPSPRPPPTIEPPPKRPLISRFDVEPEPISISKRLKTEPSTTSINPLSDSDSSSMIEEIPKKKNKTSFQKYGEEISQTTEELQRRDRRMQRFSEIEARATPPRVDTPDYVRDAQIAASMVVRFVILY